MQLSVARPNDGTPTTRQTTSVEYDTALNSTASLHNASLTINDSPSPIKPRTSRKPSPGLAARLKALGFGPHNSRRQSSNAQTTDSIGRIPAEKIDHLDVLTRANSTNSIVHRKGRAWSGTGSTKAPKIIGNSSTGFTITTANIDLGDKKKSDDNVAFLEWDTRVPEVRARRSTSVPFLDLPAMITAQDDNLDLDLHKYRLPEHTNGNGTKAMPDTRRSHLEREVSWPAEDDDPPPPPISKDTPPESTTPSDGTIQVQSYFNPLGLQRAGSIYTLSRVSFANQLAQLTSLQLPDATSLASRVSAIPSSQAAIQALMSAAEQIRSWIAKASEVLGGLDADDDVEWAAAGGREGLDEVDKAITKFDRLVNVYVSAIEELQVRSDIKSVASSELQTVVTQVESILSQWEQIRKSLAGIKSQVEVAMEWEELWNVVFGDIGNELEILRQLVFEMEEKRHRAWSDDTNDVSLPELDTIAEDTPPAKVKQKATHRMSGPAAISFGPNSPSTPTMTQDDSSLLALFARMQPLRASLDFLPIRLSTFKSKAEKLFPGACEELETRNEGLETSWQSLEKDAESLRRELGEDRWVLVFRGAGRQAQKMSESVQRSLMKLKESIDEGGHLNNPAAMGKKVESYESKKMHYGPAIERVLQIIEKGVHDRLTVNGEIVRLHKDMQSKWAALKVQMREVDQQLEEVQTDKRNQQLRDSVSTLLSNDRSTAGSAMDTPGSSPASSVIMSSNLEPNTPIRNNKMRRVSQLPQPSAHRIVTPNVAMGSAIPRKTSSRISSFGFPSPTARGNSATPTGNRIPRASLSATEPAKPRWNSSVKTKADPLGLTFNALQLTSPSPYARHGPPLGHQNRPSNATMTPVGRESRLPLRSPPSVGEGSTPRGNPNTEAVTPSKPPPRSVSRQGATPRPSSRLGYQTKITTPGPYNQAVLAQSLPPMSKPRDMKSSVSTSNLSSRRSSIQASSLASSAGLGAPGRPASSLASRQPRSGSAMGGASQLIETRNSSATRRSSLMPVARGRPGSRIAGRQSALGLTREESVDSESQPQGLKRPGWR